jgi:hypothetical protein
MDLPSFPEKASLCRFCNHLDDIHKIGGCSVEGCLCPGFALPFTKADVKMQIERAGRFGIPLEQLAEILGVPADELRENPAREGTA